MGDHEPDKRCDGSNFCMVVLSTATSIALASGALVLRPRMTVTVGLLGFIFGFLCTFGWFTRALIHLNQNKTNGEGGKGTNASYTKLCNIANKYDL